MSPFVRQIRAVGRKMFVLVRDDLEIVKRFLAKPLTSISSPFDTFQVRTYIEVVLRLGRALSQFNDVCAGPSRVKFFIY